MGELVIVRGLPGSGVTRTGKQCCNELGFDYHYEDNMFFEESVQDYFENLSLAMYECRVLTFSALIRGKSVVVSNNFITYREILPYVLMSIVVNNSLPTIFESTSDWKDSPEDCASRTSTPIKAHTIRDMLHKWEKVDTDGTPVDGGETDTKFAQYMTEINKAWAIDFNKLKHGRQRLDLMKAICG